MIFLSKILLCSVLLQISAQNILSEIASTSESTPVPKDQKPELETKESKPDKDDKSESGRRTFFIGPPFEFGSSSSSSAGSSLRHEAHKSSSFSSHKHTSISGGVVGSEHTNVLIIPPVIVSSGNSGNSLVAGSHSSSSVSHSASSHVHSSHSTSSHSQSSESNGIIQGSNQAIVGSYSSPVQEGSQIISGVHIEGESKSASSQSSNAQSSVHRGSSNEQNIVVSSGFPESSAIYDAQQSINGQGSSQETTRSHVNGRCDYPGTAPCEIVIQPEIINILPGSPGRINGGIDSSAFDSSSQTNSQINGVIYGCGSNMQRLPNLVCPPTQGIRTIVVQPGKSGTRQNNVVESYINSGSAQSQTGSNSNGIMNECGQNVQINLNIPCQIPAQNGPNIIIESGLSGQLNGGQSSSHSSQATHNSNVNGIIRGDVIQPGSADISNAETVQNGYNVGGQSSVGEYIYNNHITDQGGQLNILIPGRIVPRPRPKLPLFLGWYNPNQQYYLHLIAKFLAHSKIKIGEIKNIPSFIKKFKAGTDCTAQNIRLSATQLENYKKYLINTGLINWAPYKLIFSKKFKQKLPSMKWSVIAVKPSSMKNLYQRNIFLRSFEKLPLKLLVPAMQMKGGFLKTWAGASSITSGASGLGMAAFRSLKDTPSHIMSDLMSGEHNSKGISQPNSGEATNRNSDEIAKQNSDKATLEASYRISDDAKNRNSVEAKNINSVEATNTSSVEGTNKISDGATTRNSDVTAKQN